MNCIKNERIKNEIIKNERIKNKRIKNELIKKELIRTLMLCTDCPKGNFIAYAIFKYNCKKFQLLDEKC